MKNLLRKQLCQLLIKNGYQDIVNAIYQNKTNELSADKKEVLIKYANRIKNGTAIVSVNAGMAGFSPSSGGSGFLSGVRDGFGGEEYR